MKTEQELTATFKGMENNANALQTKHKDYFEFIKLVTLCDGKTYGLFEASIKSPFKAGAKAFGHHVYVDSEGYEVFEHQKSECLDGVWCNYGKPEIHKSQTKLVY